MLYYSKVVIMIQVFSKKQRKPLHCSGGDKMRKMVEGILHYIVSEPEECATYY